MRIFKVLLAGFVLLSATISSAKIVAWPQEFASDDGSKVVIYQPQVESFSGNDLEARAAVSVTMQGSSAPVFGAIWIVAKLDTDLSARTAVIRNIDVSDVRFAESSSEQQENLAKLIESKVNGASLEIAVDQLLSGLNTSGVDPAEVDLKHDAPLIVHSPEPAILVSIDGDAVFQAMEGSSYERVVNTPFLIVKDGSAQYLYVGSNAWFVANDVNGPWALAGSVPTDIRGLVEPEDDADLSDTKIIIATVPTELVVSDGPPSWAPVEGMNLLYMDNTDSNAFLELSTQAYYVLLSGRWYRGEGLLGDLTWEHVPNDELPLPFAEIPNESVNSPVLSQVAGTQQARDAVLENTIPQTAAIDRDDTSFSVQYDGDPDFAPIEDIQVEYAQNTSSAVFKYGNLYYAANEGVWYVANTATGPWTVATEIPDAIYKIPASNPHHNVTYVKVYDVTPEVVYVGYTPGYYGSYYYSGAVVYGTGWYYRPWYGPIYYPRYPTWGFHVHYNPWTGWNYGVSWTNGPFRFTVGTGGHGGWWGVGGFRPYPRPYVHGGYRKTNINVNIDNSINIGGGGNRPGDRPSTRQNLYDRPENKDRNIDRGNVASTRGARPATGQRNDVLADRDGNVYQRNDDGKWSTRENGQWAEASNLDRTKRDQADASLDRANRDNASDRMSTADLNRGSAENMNRNRSSQPSYSSGNLSGQHATRPQLERDYGARNQGMQRSQSFQSRGGGRRR